MKQREAGKKPVRSSTDWELIQEAQAGRLDAFEILVRRYERPVVGFCQRMVSTREDAEDIAQEAFVRVYRHLNRLEPKAKFSTVVFGIARNLALNHIRDAKRRGRHMSSSLTNEGGATIPVEDTAPGPESAVRTTELQDLISKALDFLTPEHREVLVLREMQGMDYAQIADVLKCRKGTVKSRIARAREQLRLRVLELGGDAL